MKALDYLRSWRMTQSYGPKSIDIFHKEKDRGLGEPRAVIACGNGSGQRAGPRRARGPLGKASAPERLLRVCVQREAGGMCAPFGASARGPSLPA